MEKEKRIMLHHLQLLAKAHDLLLGDIMDLTQELDQVLSEDEFTAEYPYDKPFDEVCSDVIGWVDDIKEKLGSFPLDRVVTADNFAGFEDYGTTETQVKQAIITALENADPRDFNRSGGLMTQAQAWTNKGRGLLFEFSYYCTRGGDYEAMILHVL